MTVGDAVMRRSMNDNIDSSSRILTYLPIPTRQVTHRNIRPFHGISGVALVDSLQIIRSQLRRDEINTLGTPLGYRHSVECVDSSAAFKAHLMFRSLSSYCKLSACTSSPSDSSEFQSREF